METDLEFCIKYVNNSCICVKKNTYITNLLIIRSETRHTLELTNYD